MLDETGVDMVWIARGAIGNPWIFRHAAALLGKRGEVGPWGGRVVTGDSPNVPTPPPPYRPTSLLSPPTIAEQRDALAEHFAIAMEIHGEQLAGRRMRKMGIKYSRFHPNAAEVKKRSSSPSRACGIGRTCWNAGTPPTAPASGRTRRRPTR